MNLIIFDFDCTITRRDTLRPFAKHIVKIYGNYHKLFFLYVVLILYRFKLVDDKFLKERFLSYFIKGRHISEVENIVDLFIENELTGLLNDEVFERLNHHVISGDGVYIASANFDFLLEPLMRRWGIIGVIATEVEKKDSVFTGRIAGNTCKGEQKIHKIETVLGKNGLRNAIAYADRDDICLLINAGQGIEISTRGKVGEYGNFKKRLAQFFLR